MRYADGSEVMLGDVVANPGIYGGTVAIDGADTSHIRDAR